MAETQRRPPCLEEFVASGYKAEIYEEFFGQPPWSNPSWVKADRPIDLPEGIPDSLMVHSQVRKQGSRLVRKQQPGRQRFKQHLFANPSKRLLRARPVRITSGELVTHFEELHAKERAGILAVHTVDGRRLDLSSLRDGILAMKGRTPVMVIPALVLDSIANDTPAGNELPQFLDGTFVGDPAAERVLSEMIAEKTAEGIRQGAIADTSEDPIETAPTTPPEPNPDAVEVEFVPPPPLAPVVEPTVVSSAMDPAALRAAAKKKARR